MPVFDGGCFPGTDEPSQQRYTKEYKRIFIFSRNNTYGPTGHLHKSSKAIASGFQMFVPATSALSSLVLLLPPVGDPEIGTFQGGRLVYMVAT